MVTRVRVATRFLAVVAVHRESQGARLPDLSRFVHVDDGCEVKHYFTFRMNSRGWPVHRLTPGFSPTNVKRYAPIAAVSLSRVEPHGSNPARIRRSVVLTISFALSKRYPLGTFILTVFFIQVFHRSALPDCPVFLARPFLLLCQPGDCRPTQVLFFPILFDKLQRD